jgi:hypothetical protein
VRELVEVQEQTRRMLDRIEGLMQEASVHAGLARGYMATEKTRIPTYQR